MSEYSVQVARAARKELEALDAQIQHRVVLKIDALARQPRPSGCRKLEGERFLWRIRVGDYRIVYAVYDDVRVVDVVAVRHRSDAYR